MSLSWVQTRSAARLALRIRLQATGWNTGLQHCMVLLWQTFWGLLHYYLQGCRNMDYTVVVVVVFLLNLDDFFSLPSSWHTAGQSDQMVHKHVSEQFLSVEMWNAHLHFAAPVEHGQRKAAIWSRWRVAASVPLSHFARKRPCAIFNFLTHAELREITCVDQTTVIPAEGWRSFSLLLLPSRSDVCSLLLTLNLPPRLTSLWWEVGGDECFTLGFSK